MKFIYIPGYSRLDFNHLCEIDEDVIRVKDKYEDLLTKLFLIGSIEETEPGISSLESLIFHKYTLKDAIMENL